MITINDLKKASRLLRETGMPPAKKFHLTESEIKTYKSKGWIKGNKLWGVEVVNIKK